LTIGSNTIPKSSTTTINPGNIRENKIISDNLLMKDKSIVDDKNEKNNGNSTKLIEERGSPVFIASLDEV
jgi:hypothetical protein